MRQPRRPGARVCLLVVLELLAVVLLYRLGTVRGFAVPFGRLGAWLRQAPPDEVVTASLRLVALGAAAWLLVSTLAYVGAASTRRPAALRAATWATLPAVRRWVDRAMAVSILASATLAGGAQAGGATPPPPTTSAAQPPPVVLEIDHRARAADDGSPSTTAARGGLDRAPSDSPPPPPPPPAAPGTPEAAAQQVVVAGDNLWTIASARVAVVTGRPVEAVPDSDVARYWSRVVLTNQPRLRSGDPSLIFPGEVVELPPLS